MAFFAHNKVFKSKSWEKIFTQINIIQLIFVMALTLQIKKSGVKLRKGKHSQSNGAGKTGHC